MTSLVYFAVVGWTPAFLARAYGWSSAEVGFRFGAIIGIGGTIGSIGWGWILLRVTRRYGRGLYFLLPSAIFPVAALLIVPAYFVPPQLGLSSLAVGWLLVVILSPSTYSLLQEIVPGNAVGRMTSLIVLVGAIFGSALGPLSVALVSEVIGNGGTSVGPAIAVIVAIALPIASLSWVIAWRYLPAAPADAQATAATSTAALPHAVPAES
jgi:hypothetical protein